MSLAAGAVDLLESARQAVDAIDRLYGIALERVRLRVVKGGRLDNVALDGNQLAAHALAYVATDLAACRQLFAWASGHPTAEARAIARAFIAEVARSLRSDVSLGATETYAPAEMDISPADIEATVGSAVVARWADEESAGDRYVALARADAAQRAISVGVDDDLAMLQGSFRKFVNERVIPIAQRIHRRDELIPMELIADMGDLGVFGITIPETHGGQGLGKLAMCVVTEELARGSLGVGSLATRAEIAADLILQGGTEAQKTRWLAAIAGGTVLPTAVFTEPDYGSDLAHLKTRATRLEGGKGWRIDGNKTWITHASRATLMTVLARTDPAKPDHNGLSMFLAEKRPAAHDAEFPDAGVSGSEIKVLGYRGMKEYELSFDGFCVPNDALLGGDAGLGQGFRHLMTTFETARIQTAARAVGVAQAAFDQATTYASERIQFGKRLLSMPRVARKIGRMLVLTHAARQLTLYAARMKDSGKRCDREAGMAKLLATRAAWECADAAVQIHGGNGYAEEYTVSRLLVDARVLSIFEGASEIQAHVIARRLLE
jgi:(2S)-methylsuccinyl-CoA dehydrogenase